MQKDLSLKVNEDDARSAESTFRHLEEKLRTLEGLGGSGDRGEESGEIIEQRIESATKCYFIVYLQER